jgi:hypothetical protein
MKVYEVTFKERGIETSEIVIARSILDAIGEFHRIFGWNDILKIELIP